MDGDIDLEIFKLSQAELPPDIIEPCGKRVGSVVCDRRLGRGRAQTQARQEPQF